jgi:hypothetical protein
MIIHFILIFLFLLSLMIFNRSVLAFDFFLLACYDDDKFKILQAIVGIGLLDDLPQLTLKQWPMCKSCELKTK